MRRAGGLLREATGHWQKKGAAADRKAAWGRLEAYQMPGHTGEQMSRFWTATRRAFPWAFRARKVRKLVCQAPEALISGPCR